MSAPQPSLVADCALVTWATDQQNLPPMEYKGLCRLARRAAADGSVRLSQADLAADWNATARSVVTALAGLSERGLITRQKGRGAGRGKGRQPDFIVLAFHNANFAQCNDFTEINTPCKPCEVKENQTKSTEERGITSPAPRARGLDNLSKLVDLGSNPEKESDISTGVEGGAAKAASEKQSASKPIRRKARLPLAESAALTGRHREIWAEVAVPGFAALGLEPPTIEDEWRGFVSYHVRNGTLSASWIMNWRQWCENAPKFKKSSAARMVSRAGPRNGVWNRPRPEHANT